jgi:hypothetical protein
MTHRLVAINRLANALIFNIPRFLFFLKHEGEKSFIDTNALRHVVM